MRAGDSGAGRPGRTHGGRAVGGRSSRRILALIPVLVLAAMVPDPTRATSDHQAAQALSVTALPPPDGTACGRADPTNAPPPVIATRALQTRLMVAALACDQRAAYGVFVTRFRVQLSVNADSLASRFRDRGGMDQVDRLVTRLANGAAADSIHDRAGFCARAAATLERLATTAPGDLATVAQDTWRGAGCPDW